MAKRTITHILKNSNIVARPLPTTLALGEPIVNTADGILYFSGNTQSTSGWTQAGSGATSVFFEVGSNLYDLALRHRIIQYEGVTGAGLAGKFLSGTTGGFTLANISQISTSDTFTTGFTYNNNTFTINQNNGQPALSATFNAVTGLTVNGTLSAATVQATSMSAGTIQSPIFSGGTFFGSGAGLTGINDTKATGGTFTNNTLTITNNTGGTFSVLINNFSALTVNGTFSAVTALATSVSASTVQASISLSAPLVSGTTILGTSISGGTLAGNGAAITNITAANITGLVDVKATGATFTNNLLTITNSTGGTFSTTINNFTGLTVNGILSATTALATSISGATVAASTSVTAPAIFGSTISGGTIQGASTIFAPLVTGATFSGGSFFGNGAGLTNISASNITGLVDVKATGATFSNNTLTITNSTGGTFTTNISNFAGLTSTTVSAGSVSAATISASTAIATQDLNIFGQIKTYQGNTNFANQFLSGTSGGFVLAAISAITTSDTFVTGYTYTPASNALSVNQNNGQNPLVVNLTSFSGLTANDLTANRLIYSSPASGKLITGTAIFDGTNMTLPAAGSLTVGSGGIISAGDVTVAGNLTVLGGTISAFTSQLYVEDNNITINFNPSGGTPSTSIGAGWTIQDGSGTSGSSVTLDIRAMNGFTGLTAGNIPSVTEYTGSVGFANRAWVTQLNDIVIRSTNPAIPNGVRVLAEFDILDGGVY
jgi:hypothetical protein